MTDHLICTAEQRSGMIKAVGAVSVEVGEVVKDQFKGKVSERGEQFKYPGIDQYVAKLAPLLQKHGLAVVMTEWQPPELCEVRSSKGTQTYWRYFWEIHLCHVDGAVWVSRTAVDEYAFGGGVVAGKTRSYAFKQWASKQFVIPAREKELEQSKRPKPAPYRNNAPSQRASSNGTDREKLMRAYHARWGDLRKIFPRISDANRKALQVAMCGKKSSKDMSDEDIVAVGTVVGKAVKSKSLDDIDKIIDAKEIENMKRAADTIADEKGLDDE